MDSVSLAGPLLPSTVGRLGADSLLGGESGINTCHDDPILGIAIDDLGNDRRCPWMISNDASEELAALQEDLEARFWRSTPPRQMHGE